MKKLSEFFKNRPYYLIPLAVFGILYFDWTILKGGLGVFASPFLAIAVILVFGFLYKEKVHEDITQFAERFKDQTKTRRSILVLIAIAFLLLVLFRGKLNHYLLNQNIFRLEYSMIVVLIHLKRIVKLVLISFPSFLAPALYYYLRPSFEKTITKFNGKRNNKHLVLLVFLLFLSIRLYFIFKYSGNFTDDWYHISAGKDFFDTFKLNSLNKYFDGAGYARGSYVSILVGLFVKLGLGSLNLLQLIPLLISVINFWLFNNLLTKITKTTASKIISLLIYTFVPFSIATHIYIRMYVFYEMFILLGHVLISKLGQYLLKFRSLGPLIPKITFWVLFYALAYYMSNDRGFLIIPAILLLQLIYVVVFEVRGGIKVLSDSQILKSLLNTTPTQRLLALVIISGGVLSYLFFGSSLIRTGTNLAGLGNGFSNLIVTDYFFIPVITTFSIFSITAKSSPLKRILLIPSILTLILIFFIPRHLNLIRGLIITLPTILLAFSAGLDSLVIISRKLYRYSAWIIGLLVLQIILFSYPSHFLSIGPNIPGEVAYYGYEETFDYLYSDLSDKTHVFSMYNVIPQLYWKFDQAYVIDIDGVVEGRFFPENVERIKSLGELKSLESEQEVCIVLMNYSKIYLLNEETVDHLDERYEEVLSPEGMIILCEEDNEGNL